MKEYFKSSDKDTDNIKEEAKSLHSSLSCADLMVQKEGAGDLNTKEPSLKKQGENISDSLGQNMQKFLPGDGQVDSKSKKESFLPELKLDMGEASHQPAR